MRKIVKSMIRKIVSMLLVVFLIVSESGSVWAIEYSPQTVESSSMEDESVQDGLSSDSVNYVLSENTSNNETTMDDSENEDNESVSTDVIEEDQQDISGNSTVSESEIYSEDEACSEDNAKKLISTNEVVGEIEFDGEIIDAAGAIKQMSLYEYESKMNRFINDGVHSDGAKSEYGACVEYARDWIKYMYGYSTFGLGDNTYGDKNKTYDVPINIQGSALDIRTGDVVWGYFPGRGDHAFVVLRRDGNNLYTAEGAYEKNGNYRVRVANSAYRIIDGTTISSTAGNGSFKYGRHYVSLPGDNSVPEVKNVRVDNVTDTGYDVFCEASDNEGIKSVVFPTWTEYNGQDDLKLPWVTEKERVFGHEKEGTYKFHVDISQYNNRRGIYLTDVYAYDYSNNMSACGGTARVEIKAPVPKPTILSQLDDRSVKIQSSSPIDWISIDGGNFIRYYPLNDYPLDTVGLHTVRAYSQDSSGNKSEEVSRTFSIGKAETPGRTVEETPTGTIVTFTKSNSRSVIWYSINGGGYQKYTSQIKRTDNTTIRYYSTRTGCVQSDVMEYKLIVPIPKKPVATLGNQTRQIGLGDVIMVKFDKQKMASQYICTIKKDDVFYKTVTSTDNNVSIKANDPGNYVITGKAKNSFGESEYSNEVSIVVMDDVTVSFEDWDGNPLCKAKRIKWGGSLSNEDVPVAPTREGYDFQGWSRYYTNVTSDTVIVPIYKIKVFTVKFMKDDDCIKTQRVEWKKSADEPDMSEYIPAPGYIFAGWNVDKSSDCEDFKCVTGNMTLYSSFTWENSNFTAAISDFKVECKSTSESAEEGDQYYDVNATLTGNPEKKTSASVIVELSTGAGKTVTVKTEDIQVLAGETSKALHFIINSSADASKATMYIVGFDDSTNGKKTTGTYAKSVQTNITRKVYYGNWSAWSTTKPTADQIATKNQYRYNTKSTATSTTSKTMTGYTLVSTDTKVGNWSAWQDGSVSAVNKDSLKREVQTQKVVTGTSYKYGHYCGKTNLGWETFPWNSSAFVSNAAYHELGTFSVDDPRIQYAGVASDTGSQLWCYYPDGNRYRCSNNCFYWYRMGDPIYTYKTQYRYRDTTYVYHFEKISAWSSWSDTKPASYNQLQTRKVYRGRNEIPGTPLDEVNDTDTIHVNGSLSDSGNLQNKIATVFVYKETNTDPLENQIEYMDEVKLGENNSYSLNIIPKENISAKTGNYIIAFAVEGANRLINAEVVSAPKDFYTVNFIAEGNIISTQTVEAHSNAEIPDAPIVEGKDFVKWSASTVNVKQDMDVEAIYQDASYSVVYVDKMNGTVDIAYATYGEPVGKDYPTAPEGYRFVGWDAQTVSGNMVVNAVYEKEVYTVTFMDASGENVVETKHCAYGESVLPPSYEYLSAEEGQRITGWSMEKNWRNVTEDMMVYPVVEWEKTADTPYSSVTSLELCHYNYVDCNIDTKYPTVDLLSDDEDAKIYFTTDGSDPDFPGENVVDEAELSSAGNISANTVLYSEPIVITSDTNIRAICLVDGKNVSEVAEFPIKLKEVECYAMEDMGNNETDIVNLTGISIPSEMEVSVGADAIVPVTYIPSNASNTNLSWSVSDNQIATVSSNGVIRGVSIGVTTVTATAEDGGFTASCKVRVVQDSGREAEDDVVPEEAPEGIWLKGLNDSYTYTGNAIKPSFRVYYGTTRLYESSDYTLKYAKNINPGMATITIKMKGNYSGTKTVTFKIKPASLESDIEADAVYVAYKKNKTQKPKPVLYMNGSKIKYGENDLTFTYPSTSASGNGIPYVDEGDYKIHITAKNTEKFEGEKVVDLIIVNKPLMSAVSIKPNRRSIPYNNGNAVEPVFTLKYKNSLLSEGRDYTVSYNDAHSDIGKHTVSFIGNNTEYFGKKTYTFSITGKYDLTSTKAEVVLDELDLNSDGSVPYTCGGARPRVVVKYEGAKLTVGQDYTVSYANNKSLGTATAIIKGKGRYKGSVPKSFIIKERDINTISLNIADKDYSFKANNYKKVSIIFVDKNYKNQKLKQDTDYTLKFDEDYGLVPEAGTEIKVTLKGKGNYNGIIHSSYRIIDKNYDFTKAKVVVNSGKAFEYTGKEIRPMTSDLTVTLNNSPLKADNYEILGYYNNIKKGNSAYIALRGKNNYAGVKLVKFKIGAADISDLWSGVIMRFRNAFAW